MKFVRRRGTRADMGSERTNSQSFRAKSTAVKPDYLAWYPKRRNYATSGTPPDLMTRCLV